MAISEWINLAWNVQISPQSTPTQMTLIKASLAGPIFHRKTLEKAVRSGCRFTKQTTANQQEQPHCSFF